MKGLIAAALLAALPAAYAETMQEATSMDLCTALASSMILGQPEAARSKLVAELRGRNELCAPSDLYIRLAETRLRLMRENSTAQAQEETDKELARQERNARIRAAGRAMLQMQQDQDAQRRATTPTTTRCMPNGIGGVNCTTN